MSGKRVIVVGASSGLGRCLGVGLAQRGSRVGLLARRQELLESAVAEAGDGAVAIRCDATDEAGCKEAIERAASELGGIDAVIYSTAVGELRRIEDLDSATWHRVFDTNVVGASTVTAAAFPHLQASSGMMAYLTSVSASMTAPWPGLASYTVTKAALDRLVEAWRSEHPEVGFTQLIVGECSGGEGAGASQFTSSWDFDLAGEMYPMWTARGLLSEMNMNVEDFVDAVGGLLQAGSSMAVPTVAMTPRRPI
jgi:NAD(P)-dependent dehydrogenase (short-subunit alcohol dehydrogenase family)